MEYHQNYFLTKAASMCPLASALIYSVIACVCSRGLEMHLPVGGKGGEDPHSATASVHRSGDGTHLSIRGGGGRDLADGNITFPLWWDIFNNTSQQDSRSLSSGDISHEQALYMGLSLLFSTIVLSVSACVMNIKSLSILIPTPILGSVLADPQTSQDV